MDRVPDYRTPEWRGWIEHGLMWGDWGIDAAMEWAYDQGIAAQSDYVRSEHTLVCRPEDEQKMRALATGLPWLKVQASDLCPLGKAFLINESASR